MRRWPRPCTAGPGNDTLTGGAGADSLDGGDGNDVFQVRGGADTITGGTGDDSLIASLATLGQGATFDGGTGRNQVKLIGSAGANSFKAAADGTTRVRLSSYSGTVESAYLFATNVQSLIMDGRGGADRFVFVGNLSQAGITLITADLGNSAGNSVEISLTDQDDVLKLSDSVTTPNSLTGSWVGHSEYSLLSVNPSGGNTLALHGGLGNDLLCGATVTNSPFAQISFSGEDGDDVIVGTAQNDLVDGGPGNDQLTGGAGTDIFQDAGGYNTLVEVFDSDFGLFGNLLIVGAAQLSGTGENLALAAFTNSTVENIDGIFSEAHLVGGAGSNEFAIGAAAGAVNVNGVVKIATPWAGIVKLNGLGGADVYLAELRGLDGAAVQAIETADAGNDLLVFKGSGLSDSGSVWAADGMTTFSLQASGAAVSQVVTTPDIETNSLYLLPGDDVVTVYSISVSPLVAAGDGNDTINVQTISGATTVNAGAATTRSTWAAWRRMRAGR